MTSDRSRNSSAEQKVSEDELPEANELDILAKQSEKATDLSATVGAFAARMQRRKREQEELNSVADQASRVRQQLLMKSMVKIRRSLEEVERIDLGDRYFLELQKDDLHGWPRFTLRFLDKTLEQHDLPFLRVVAHDRQGRGAIEITYLPSEPMEQLSLARDADVARLPTALKMCVRAYLDLIGEMVLASERSKDSEEAELEALSRSVTDAEAERDPNEIGETDFFDEGFAGGDSFERLPELDHVQLLTTSTKQ